MVTGEVVPQSIIGQSSDIETNRLALAQERDRRVRELERRHVATWSEMAELCRLIDEQGDWKVLGFESYGKWLKDAAPQSRSAVYAARGILEELKEVPTDEIRQMALGSAKALAMVPASKRTRELVRRATQERPQAFTATVQAKHPELHIETTMPRKFKFEASQSMVIDAAMLMANILETGELMDEPEMAPEALLEKICADYMDRHRGMYEKIKAGL